MRCAADSCFVKRGGNSGNNHQGTLYEFSPNPPSEALHISASGDQLTDLSSPLDVYGLFKQLEVIK